MFCFQGGVASPEEEEDNVQALEIIIKIIMITIFANDVIIIIISFNDDDVHCKEGS